MWSHSAIFTKTEMKFFLVALWVCSFFLKLSLQCTERFTELSLVTYRASQTSRIGDYLDDKIRVLEEFQFNCTYTTNITHLLLGIDVRPVTNNRNLFPSVTIFRPQSSMSNQYNTVPGSERTIYYTPANVSTSGVFQYPLVPPISVMNGDLLAISYPKESDSAVRVFYIQGAVSRNHEVSFGETSFQSGSSPITNQLVLVYPIISDEQCINSTVTGSFIKEKALMTHNEEKMKDKRQFIYPDIMFTCNGSVTKWIYGGEMDDDNPMMKPEIQIWRPMGGNNYNKVGASLVDTNTVNNTNVYEFIPQLPLVFQEGDIFGIHVPEKSQTNLNLLEQRRNGPLNLRISGDVFTAPTNIAQDLQTENNNDFPLVTVEIITASSTMTEYSPTVISIVQTITTIMTEMVLSTVMSNLTASTAILTPTLAITMFSSIASITTTRSTATVKRTEDSSMESTISSSFMTIEISSSNIITLTPVITSSNTVVFSNKPINNPSSSDSSYLIGVIVGIIMSLLLIAIIISFTIIIVILLRRRKTTASKDISKETQDNIPLDNPMYSEAYQMVSRTNSLKAKVDIPHYEEHSFYETPGQMTNPNYSELVNYEEPIAIITERHQIRNVQPVYEGIVVPTMYERSQAVEQENIYFELQNNLYSSLSKTDHEYKVVEMSSDGSFFFTEADVYWAPGSDCCSIYEQLSIYKFREVIREHIQITSLLGSGQFGTVHKGIWNTSTGSIDVAIKTLNDTSEEEKVKFLQEAAIMGQFRHPNIIQLHGVVTIGEPVMIVIEMMSNGDLKQYLETLKPSPGELVLSTVPGLLLRYCRQIASGMDYLSNKYFVHRDLAARNILVTEQGNICKISDFGLSRDLQDSDYYVSQGGQIPIKWTAPEALRYKKYSSASDVWSFGAVMYEIWSLGYKPFHNMTNQESFKKIDSGYRLPPPPGCPRAVYEIMTQCWHPESNQRPLFADLVTRLSQSDSSLMSWSQNDSSVHPQASILGASLDVGEKLYTDLQFIYNN